MSIFGEVEREYRARTLENTRSRDVADDPFTLARPIVQLGDTPNWLTWGDCCEHFQVLGGTGSGKSSTAGRAIAEGMLAALAGAVFLTTKPGDAKTYRDIARGASRDQDVRVMRVGGDVAINLVAQAYGLGGTEDVVRVLSIASGLVSASEDGNSSDDLIWAQSRDLCLRNLVDMLVGAGEELTLTNIAALLAAAPQTAREADRLLQLENDLASGKRTISDLNYFERVWLKLGQRFREGELKLHANTVDALQLYFLREYPRLPDRTAGSIRFSVSTAIGALTRGEIAELCTKRTTFDLADLRRRGTILILDLAPHEIGEAGRIVQAIVKYLVQREIQRGDCAPAENVRPVGIFIDEASGYVGPEDIEFAQLARSARGCAVYTTQSRASYVMRLGEIGTRALLEVLDTKIIFNSTGDTAEWAANELVGEDWDYEPTVGGDGSISLHEERRCRVEPVEFARLARGGEKFGFVAESIVFKPGHRFQPTGENFVRVGWRQG